MRDILFSLGGFSLRSYGVIVALAVLLGLGVAYSLAANEKEYRNHLVNVVLYGVIGGVIGARFWEVFFFQWGYYSKHLIEIPMIWMGGASILGALVGAFVVGWLYTRKHRLSFWRFADIAAPGLIFGQAVGRFACLLNGDAFGSPTNSGIGLIYPPGTPAYAAYGSKPLWPAEVWEGQWDLVVFAIILILSHWRKWPKGVLFLAYITLYSVGRFSLEFLRGDSPRFLFGWTAAQWTSVVMILISVTAALIRLLQDKNVNQNNVEVMS